ncbi:MAG: hypothetical protein Q4E07_05210 [Eubacteriales bacterium]|nr:hypothetical protein [Eubacteriales bacterium]
MEGFVAITYFYQSTFAVALGKTLLIFSYHENNELAKTMAIGDKDLENFNNIVVFAPSPSAEHFDNVVFNWKQSYPINYVLHKDCADRSPKNPNIRFVKHGDIFSIADVFVRVFDAAGQGLCFLVNSHSTSIFHAGDLNLWHWRDERQALEIAKTEKAYYEAVEKIPKEPLDLCMFPLDPNQGSLFEAGANHIMMSLKPKLFLPMHFGFNFDAVREYSRRMKFPSTIIYPMQPNRETIQVNFANLPLNIHKIQSEENLRRAYSLGAYINENPFSDTDLPVDLG